jgi:hypothetical protein
MSRMKRSCPFRAFRHGSPVKKFREMVRSRQAMNKIITSGKHEFSLEDGNVMVLRFGSSPVTATDVLAMYDLEREILTLPYVFSLVILDDGTSITPGTISQIGKTFSKGPPRSTAVIVRRFFLRNAMEFVVRSVRLLGGKVELAFVEDEHAGRK